MSDLSPCADLGSVPRSPAGKTASLVYRPDREPRALLGNVRMRVGAAGADCATTCTAAGGSCHADSFKAILHCTMVREATHCDTCVVEGPGPWPGVRDEGGVARCGVSRGSRPTCEAKQGGVRRVCPCEVGVGAA